MYVNKTICLQDILHRANSFIMMEEVKQTNLLKQSAMKQVATKSANTYQEPIQHSDNKLDKNKNIISFFIENAGFDSAAIALESPWNVWKNEIDGLPPQAFSIPQGATS
ncbi:hypothetical protein F2Q70_00003552 [Brassica cretica]|uniref:Uncharacterized protein n=1 Tax=Brassica cretica TaxID=69181 RepID=A0A8S9J2B3_BRACR|nr:hypothetical protein F2Q70_00003552 [Brassica cretica]